jgi:SlyX protein
LNHEVLARLEERLNELEIKVIFQDDLLNTLNDIITRQDQEILKLWDANRLLKQNMEEINSGEKGVPVDVPPHY